MDAPPNVHLPIALFTLDPSQTGGRKARTGFAFQDQYIASVLTGFLVGHEEFLAARIEAVEDLDVIIKIDDGWLERYYQIKTRQEGSNRWTISALDKESVWTRFFSLYRRFVLQQTDRTRKVQFVIAVEGDLDPELIELRENGSAAVSPRGKLLSILATAVSKEGLGTDLNPRAYVDNLLDNFIATLRFDSRVGHLREIAFNKLILSGDVSPAEAQQAFEQLLNSVRDESARSQPALITSSTLRDWLGFPERAIFQKKPVAEPDEVRRIGSIAALKTTLESMKVILLYGTPKIGKSHLVSAMIENLDQADSYFWFTFSGGDRDTDSFAFQLASWAGQRTLIWQVKDDFQLGYLRPDEAIQRLRNIPVKNVLLVLDDCHKAKDRGFLEAVAALIDGGWTDAKIIFVSENKIPELAAIGVHEHKITGLEPKEGIRFLGNLGIDVRDSTVELAMLCIQADGHPALLRAIATELTARPSREEVTNLSSSLMTAKSAQPFLHLLSERVMRSLKVEAHRLWLARLAVLAFSFRRDLAMEISRLTPAINVAEADWNFLASRVFDQTGADQYLVPTLLRPLLKLNQPQPDANVVLVASARHIFRTARASSRIDFWDFHSALLALIVAQHYDEAAYHFIVGMGTSRRPVPLAALEILFLVLNGELVQQNLDPPTRFTLLVVEVNIRLLDERAPDYSKIFALIRKTRVAQKKQPLTKLSYAKAMIHILVVFARLRRIKDNNVVNIRAQSRAFASIEAALRIALTQDDATITLHLLEFYGQLYFLAQRPDLDLLKRAILGTAPEPMVISGNSLISIYTKFAVARKYDDEALMLCERHASDYRAGRHADAFFAAEHTIATILIDRFGKYGDARKRIAESGRIADTLGASPSVLGRADLLIADSYWAEKDYANSARHYEGLLNVDFSDESLTQWVREKLSDSLMAQSRFEEASRQLIQNLRMTNRRIPPLYKGRLYARLAYAYAEGNLLKKASIACLGLHRIAEASALPEIDRLFGIVSGWVLQHFKYSDPAIPQVDLQIRDSSSLSESASPEQIDLWKNLGPPFVRGLMHVSAAFEFLGEFCRSEWLCRKALEAAKRDKDQKRLQETEYTYQLRLARIQIRNHKLSAAAATFKIAADGLLNLRREEVLTTPTGGTAYVILTLVEPSFGNCSDSEIVQFFEELDGQFDGDPGIRAWLLYRESEFLFDRLLVQTARRILLEAERLAKSCDEYELQWALLHSKLFVHMQQMYRDQTLWFRDVLEAGLLLATDSRLAARQPDFASVVTRLTARFKSAIGEVSSVITEVGRRSSIDPFWITFFALWKVAKRNRFTIGCLSEVERMLRNSGVIASEDFG